MLKNLKRNFAKLALSVLAMQLVFMGLGTGATGAYAIVGTDLIAPTVNSISYGGNSAVLNVNNTYVVDATKADNTQLQDINIAVSESSSLDVTVLANTATVPLTGTGVEVVHIPDYLGGATKTAFEADARAMLTPYADLLGNVTLQLKLSDTAAPTPNVSNYSLVVELVDKVNPIASDLSFAGVPATYAAGVFNVDMTGISNTDLATAKIEFTTSETAMISVTSPFTFSAAMVGGVQTLDLTGLNGGTPVTLADLDSIADITGQKVVLAVTLTDEASNFTKYEINLNLDKLAPIVTMTSIPVIVNDVSKSLQVTFTGNEAIQLQGATQVSFTQGSTILLVTPEVQVNPLEVVALVSAGTFDAGTTPIGVLATFEDNATNTTVFTGQITVDTIAPSAVTDLVASTDAAGHVTLTWVNPPAGSYSTLRVVRVGDFTVTLDPTDATYTDLTTEKGKTYQYVVVVGDNAGNETATPQVTVSVPAAVVAAAVSDNYVPENNTDTNTNKEDVKAITTDSQDENNTTEDDGFPTWGIILLLVLAAVGGYLIWSQKPEPDKTPETKGTKTNTPKKK